MKQRIDRKTVLDILNNSESMPEQYRIGSDCTHNHGFNGKTIRYKTTGTCIVCARDNSKKSRRKEFEKKPHSVLIDIDHKLEELRLAKELGDVFDD